MLVVDDNVDSAESLTMLFQLIGHDTRTAQAAPRRWMRLARSTLKWSSSTSASPAMNGYEVARRMRERPPLGEALLVALTGWGSDDDKRHRARPGSTTT